MLQAPQLGRYSPPTQNAGIDNDSQAGSQGSPPDMQEMPPSSSNSSCSNTETQEPEGDTEWSDPHAGLPPGWSAFTTADGRVFYGKLEPESMTMPASDANIASQGQESQGSSWPLRKAISRDGTDSDSDDEESISDGKPKYHLSNVVCNKCQQKGHYANRCPNR